MYSAKILALALAFVLRLLLPLHFEDIDGCEDPWEHYLSTKFVLSPLLRHSYAGLNSVGVYASSVSSITFKVTMVGGGRVLKCSKGMYKLTTVQTEVCLQQIHSYWYFRLSTSQYQFYIKPSPRPHLCRMKYAGYFSNLSRMRLGWCWNSANIDWFIAKER